MTTASRRLLLAASLLTLAGCTDTPDRVTSPYTIRAGSRGGGKGGSGGTTGPAVTAADPAYGEQGQVGEQVTITGSGFSPDAQASWELNGAPAGRVHVRSTTYISSTQVVATIDIDADADLAFYDVAVTSSGKKGIGTEVFEVTQAFAIEGTQNALDVNDAGQVVVQAPDKGRSWHPAIWTPQFPGARVGTLVSLGSGIPAAIDEAGTVLSGQGGLPFYWRNTPSGWVGPIQLPHDPAVTVGYAPSVASDPATGVARWIGGWENTTDGSRPRLWSYDAAAASFTRVVLPVPAGARKGRVHYVNANGQAVGDVVTASNDTLAALWTADGTLTLLVPDHGISFGWAIAESGDIVVGASNGQAVYWTRLPDGTWSAPLVLPGSCAAARGIDLGGDIVGRNCSAGGGRIYSVIWKPPYTAVIRLGGLGDKNNAGSAVAISPSGAFAVGSATIRSAYYGTVWTGF